MSHSTPVVFRKDREGDVFALLPSIPWDYSGHSCTSYQSIGQHAAADYRGCIRRSIPAAPAEYAQVLGELERAGYSLRIIRRASPKVHRLRRATSRANRARGAVTRHPTPTDAEVSHHGSIALLTPLTPRAREWVEEHLVGEVTRFGRGIAVEPRYLADVVQGMIDDGLAVSG